MADELADVDCVPDTDRVCDGVPERVPVCVRDCDRLPLPVDVSDRVIVRDCV